MEFTPADLLVIEQALKDAKMLAGVRAETIMPELCGDAIDGDRETFLEQELADCYTMLGLYGKLLVELTEWSERQ